MAYEKVETEVSRILALMGGHDRRTCKCCERLRQELRQEIERLWAPVPAKG